MINQIKAIILGRLRGETSTSKLVKLGLKVGSNFNRQQGCIIDYSHCWLVSIGDNVTLAPRVQILAHDASTKMLLNYTRIGLVEIGNNVFIGAGTIILPNVKIGSNVIIGAGSLITKNIQDNTIVVGNPARVISGSDEFLEKNRELMKIRPIYNDSYTLRKNITNNQKMQMINELKDGIGYVE